MQSDAGRSNKRPSKNHKLQLATQRVVENWIPANQTVLSQIRGTLVKKEFDSEQIIQALKADPCLFSFCLRELLIAANGGLQTELANNPIALMGSVTTETLTQIICRPRNKLLSFTKHSARRHQKKLVQQTLSATVAAEVLAEEFGADPSLTYVCSLLSHLGLLMIAWTFPESFDAAENAIANNGYSPEDALTIALGFSPHMLSFQILQDLQLGDELLELITATSGQLPKDATDADDFIVKIVELSSAFGQTSNPALYPESQHTWEALCADLENALGAESAKRIEKKINRRLQGYVHTGFIKECEFNAEHRGLQLQTKNQYIQQCPVELQKKLHECYALIETESLARQALDFLNRTILPAVHFKNGALFFFDDRSNTLIPRYQIGTKGLEKFESFDVQATYDAEHPVLAAFYSNVPALQMDTLSNEPGLSSISVSIKSPAASAVLYLEMDTTYHREEEIDTLQVFKAISLLTQHSLGIS